MSYDINRDEAITLDKMLSYMAERQNGLYTVDDYKRDILPDLEEWQIEHLLKILESKHPPIVVSESSTYFRIEPNGRKFLLDGGFTNWFDKKLEEKKHETKVSELQFEQLKKNVEDLGNRLKTFKPSNKRANIAILIAAIGTVIAGITLYLKLTGQ